MARTPARRTPRPKAGSPPVTPGTPVEVRLVGHEEDVHRLIAAMQGAAGRSAGAVTYRPSRYTLGALRAYLSLAIPAVEEQL